MRSQRDGVIVNVTSSVVLAPFPFAAAHTATKTAIEGFSRPLAQEVGAFNNGIRLVQARSGWPSSRR